MLITLPSRNAGPEAIINSATVSFVNTGDAKLLVTCDHVVADFESLRSANSDAVVAIAGGQQKHPICIGDYTIVDRDAGLDLATLKLPDETRIQQIQKNYFPCDNWPPRRPAVNDFVVMLGFPALHREASARGLEVRETPVCDFVSSTSDRHFVLADEAAERTITKFIPDLKDFGPLGGMSGAAAYVVDPSTNKLCIAGFMYEAGADATGLIYISNAEYLNADGRFDRPAMPW